MKQMLVTGLLIMCMVSGIFAQAKSSSKGSATTTGSMTTGSAVSKSISPIDPADQLEVVRLSAEIVDVQAQIMAAEVHKALNDKLRDLSLKQQQVLESIKAKLPKPEAGKEWEARPDGKYGVTFVQVDTKPEAKAEAKP